MHDSESVHLNLYWYIRGGDSTTMNSIAWALVVHISSVGHGFTCQQVDRKMDMIFEICDTAVNSGPATISDPCQ